LDWSLGELRLNGSIYVTASIHDIWLGVMERDDVLEIVLAYSHELFDVTRAREWVAWMERTVQRVVARPDVPVAQLILPEDEQQDAFWLAENAKAPAAANRVDEVTVRKGHSQNI